MCTLFFVCTTLIFAQDPLEVHHDVNIQQLSIGDIDFGDFGSSNFLFSVTINVTGSVRLKGTINIQLDDGTAYDVLEEPFCTEPFDGPRTISNLDIGKNSSIRTETFKLSQVAKDDLQKKALAIGRLPSGVYTFKLELWDAGQSCGTTTTKYDEKIIVLTLQTITRLDLIYPPDGTTLNTLFPLFQWIYDGRELELSVYERLPQHASREEAASSVPHLVARTPTDLPEGSTTYQYPTAALRVLEAGHTYVWKVKGISRGTGGVGSEINSEIGQFTIAENTSSSSSSGEIQNVSNLLQFLYGVSEQMLNDLLSGNLQLTGVILLDGRQLSAAEILALLQDLAANPDRIINIQIVDL
jgi:hypothetical protein